MSTEERRQLIKHIQYFGGKASLKESTVRLKNKLIKVQKEFVKGSIKENPFKMTKTQRNQTKRYRKKISKQKN